MYTGKRPEDISKLTSEHETQILSLKERIESLGQALQEKTDLIQLITKENSENLEKYDKDKSSEIHMLKSTIQAKACT